MPDPAAADSSGYAYSQRLPIYLGILIANGKPPIRGRADEMEKQFNTKCPYLGEMYRDWIKMERDLWSLYERTYLMTDASAPSSTPPSGKYSLNVPTIESLNGASATASVAGGIIESVSIDNGGSGYTTEPVWTLFPPAYGAGAVSKAVEPPPKTGEDKSSTDSGSWRDRPPML